MLVNSVSTVMFYVSLSEKLWMNGAMEERQSLLHKLVDELAKTHAAPFAIFFLETHSVVIKKVIDDLVTSEPNPVVAAE